MISPVEAIKERLSIVDVISMYMQLVPAGKNYKGKSPFKQERTPSFYVSPDKGLYHCFSTGKGGDMFTFVQEMEGLDFRGALKVLADKAGISLSGWNPKEHEEKSKLFDVMEAATKFFEKELTKHPEVLEYIKGRGVTEETMREFRIGYVPDGWNNLFDALKAQFKEEDLVTVGLIKKGNRGFYDTFRDRVMFPICDSSGRVIAFSGRIFHDTPAPDGSRQAKYVNSPDTPLFNKSDVLFGIDKAKHAIRKYNFTTIVEGQFDVIMLHQAGFKNTVAVSGTALSDSFVGRDHQVNNLGIVKRLSNNLVLAFDSDSAGIQAARRSASIGLSLGMDVKVIDIQGGKDPADIIHAGGKDAWSALLRSAEHILLFSVSKIKERARDQREVGRRVQEEVLPELALIKSEIEKAYFIKEISNRTGISERALLLDTQHVRKPAHTENPSPEKEDSSPPAFSPPSLERGIWGMYVESNKDEKVKEKIVSVIGEEEFQSLAASFEGNESEFIFGETHYLDAQEETLRHYKKHLLQKKIVEVKEALRKAELAGDEDGAEQLLKEQQAIEKERDVINNSRYFTN